MAPDKNLKLSPEELVELVPNRGLGLASDMITVDGLPILYMYREKPQFETDSGWRFFSGKETQAYVNDADNLGLYDINTVANYDHSIIPYLELPVGSELVRKTGSDQFSMV